MFPFGFPIVRNGMSTGLDGMSGGGGTSSQMIDGAGGKQTGHMTEIVVKNGIVNKTCLPLNKLNDGNTTKDAGKIGSGKRKTRNKILDGLKERAVTQKVLMQTKRSPTLNCQGRSRKIPTRSEGW